MKILALNPPFLKKKFSREQRSPAVTKSGTFYYPMWLAYATGLLEKNGFHVTLMDCPAQNRDEDFVKMFLTTEKPDMVIIDTSTPSIHNDVTFAEMAKKILPGCYTLLVGPHVSAMPEESLKLSPYADAAAIGEYDYTALELAKALRDKTPLDDIKGLVFRKGNEIKRNPVREWITDMDGLPFVSSVYRKHLNHHNYFYAHSKFPIIVILGGRGCPHHCTYCVYPQTFSGRQVRFRSVKNVVDEMEYIIKEFPDVKEIMFEDDTLTVNKKRSRELAEEILNRKIKMIWSANSRADVDLETMKLLHSSGCRLFCVGIESGAQEVLDSMKKNLKIERIRQFFADAKKAKILIHGCFLLGCPGETKKTLVKTLEFAKELNPDTAQFFPLMVYPGTEAYDWAKANGYLTTGDFKDWLTKEGMHNCVVSRPELTNEELVDFCDYARKEFYLRAKYIGTKLLQALKHPSESKRLFKGAKSLAKHLMKKVREKK